MGIRVALSAWIVVAVAVLVHFERREDDGRARAAKTAASLGFVALAFAAGAVHRGGYGHAVLGGLLLSAAGDVALAFRGKKPFLVGLSAFLSAHVAYVLAAATRLPMVAWPSMWSILPVAVSGVVTAWLWPHLGSMRGPVIAYVAAITVMVAGAIAVFSNEGQPALLLLLGAGLFYLSDLSVARDRFVSPGFVNKAWGLPAYYAGQILFAWSLA